MDILFVTSTFAPYSGNGPVAEACAALPKALRGLDHHVVVVSPLYASVDPATHSLARRLSRLEFRLGTREVRCEIYDGRTTGGVDLVFIGAPEEGFLDWQPPEHPDEWIASSDDTRRAAVLSHAAVQLATASDHTWDVIHGVDWPGALALTLAARESSLGQAGRVLTIYQPASDGRMDPKDWTNHGLAETIAPAEGALIDGQVSFLATGVAQADRIVFPAESTARRLADPAAPSPLGATLRTAEERLRGIVPGVDSALWNPLTDMHLAARFDAVDLSGKVQSKTKLQQQCALDENPSVPLLTVIEPLEGATGAALVEALRGLLRNDVQIAVVGGGDDDLLSALEAPADQTPGQLGVMRDADNARRHLAIGGADLVLVPPRPWSSGVGPMIAHRYGTIPIAARAWGDGDVVIDCDAQLQTGNGWLFDNDSENLASEALAASQRALAAYDRGDDFTRLRQRVMRLDHSWERAARRYATAYTEATAQREA